MARKKERLEAAPVQETPPWRGISWLSLGACVFFWVLSGWLYYREPGWVEQWSKWRFWLNLFPPFGQTQPAMIFTALKTTALLLWLMSIAYGLGRSLLHRAKLHAGEKLGHWLLSLAAGWGLLGLGMLGLGLVKLWRLDILLAGLAALSLFTTIDRHRNPTPKEPLSEAPPHWTPWEGLCVFIFALFAGFNFTCAFMPEIFYDALVYHLALPDLYWRHGGIVPTPENIFSGMPLLVQSLYAAGLALGGEPLTHLIHWAFGLCAALMTYAIARRWSGRSAGCLAALLFYSIPLTCNLSWKSGIELGWAFFQLAAVYAMVLRATSSQGGWTLFSGVLTGFAMGTKYQAWPLIGVLPIVLAWALPAGPRQKAKEAAWFILAAAATTAPWCLKNMLLYRNPLYPFFQEFFSRQAVPHWRELLSDGGRDLGATLTSWAGLKSYALHPWHFTFQTMDNGPILLLILPALILFRYKNPALALIWSAFLGLWGVLSLSAGHFRYLLPHLPLACVLLAVAFEEGLRSRAKSVLRLGLLFIFCSHFILSVYWFKVLGAHGVILGLQPAAEYLKKSHPSYHAPSYPAMEFINANLPQNARILFLGEARGFHCRRDYISTTVFDESPLQSWVNRSASPQELLNFFREEKVTHVLVNRLELARWQNQAKRFLELDQRGLKVWQDFMVRFLRPVFENEGPAPRGMPETWTVVYELSLDRN